MKTKQILDEFEKDFLEGLFPFRPSNKGIEKVKISFSKALHKQREEMKEKIMNTLDSIDKKRTETLKNSQSTYSENGYANSYEIVKLLLKKL